MENDRPSQDEIEDQDDDDLNFYDLLEGIADRFDSISQRSKNL